MKTLIPIAIAFLSGVAMIAAFMLNPDKIGDIEGEMLQWASIIGGFTLLLGVVSIVRVNWKPVTQTRVGLVQQGGTTLGRICHWHPFDSAGELVSSLRH